jgi:hypothetical protein
MYRDNTVSQVMPLFFLVSMLNDPSCRFAIHYSLQTYPSDLMNRFIKGFIFSILGKLFHIHLLTPLILQALVQFDLKNV